jgi:cytochrome oxidase Cu insertion factor (SCO1/SenC/PrrC family)
VLLAAWTLQAPPAFADGDPASDVLIGHTSFVPADAHAGAREQARLDSLLSSANASGLPLRVAVIPSGYDLGSVTTVWRKPRVYADYLGFELSRSFHSLLVVVMPNGFGLHWPGHPTAALYRRLSKVTISPGGGRLLPAAEDAVRLAMSSAGVTAASASSGGGVPALAIVAIALALLGAFALLLLRWRGSAPARSIAAKLAHGRSHVATTGARLGIKPLVALEMVAVGALAATAAVVVATRLLNSGTPSASAFADAPAPPFTFAAHARHAPPFALRDQNGRPISLSAFRGKPVILTFVDPLCRNLCPLAAHVLNAVDNQLPPRQRVPIIAVSVDVYADTRHDLLQDFKRWSLVHEWHWAVGTPKQLASVWDRYGIGVSVTTKKIAGVTAHYIEHDESAYVVDPSGYERALFTWPYSAAGVEHTLARVSRA